MEADFGFQNHGGRLMRDELKQVFALARLKTGERMHQEAELLAHVREEQRAHMPAEMWKAGADAWLALFARNLIPEGEFPAFDTALQKAGGKTGVVGDLETCGVLVSIMYAMWDEGISHAERKVGVHHDKERRAYSWPTFGGPIPKREIELLHAKGAEEPLTLDVGDTQFAIASWDERRLLIDKGVGARILIVDRQAFDQWFRTLP